MLGKGRAVLSLWLITRTGCDDGELRGSIRSSPDGETYLVVLDDNGGTCGAIHVDRQAWARKSGEAGKVSPGRHAIACGEGGAVIEFDIPAGQVYSFGDWGP
jgi:hypothetical protein